MNHSIQVVLIAMLCGGQLCCKEWGSKSDSPAETRTAPQDPLMSTLERMGGRLPRENDVPFVSAPMTDMASLEVLLGHMKQAGISLALPESIHLGNGLWKIAPQDVEKGHAVVQRYHLKNLLKTCHFESQSRDTLTNKK